MAGSAVVTEKQMVLFELGGETYGLDIAVVREIITMQPITRVPKAPVFVEGVINLRGKVIPVINMSTRFGMAKTQVSKNTRIVVVDIKGATIGIVVEVVTEVVRIQDSAVESASDIVVAADSQYLQGIAKLNGKMVILLDLEKALSKEEIMTSSKGAAN